MCEKCAATYTEIIAAARAALRERFGGEGHAADAVPLTLLSAALIAAKEDDQMLALKEALLPVAVSLIAGPPPTTH